MKIAKEEMHTAVYTHRMMMLYMHILFDDSIEDFLPGDARQLDLHEGGLGSRKTTDNAVILRHLPYWDINRDRLAQAWDAACISDVFVEDILKMRYLEYLTFDTIGLELAITARTATHKHNKGASIFVHRIPPIEPFIIADRHLFDF
jgi:hypothetical protein